MKHWLSGRRATSALALGVALALVSLPAAAADGGATDHPSIELRAAVRKVAATERLAPAAPAVARMQSGSAPNLESTSFFKTPLGLAVIAIVGAGSAYAVYSSQHDRIHSAAR